MQKNNAVKYSFLCAKIVERGIKKKAIAKALGITDRALRNKIAGLSDFTWTETNIVQECFFPDVHKDDLFMFNNEVPA